MNRNQKEGTGPSDHLEDHDHLKNKRRNLKGGKKPPLLGHQMGRKALKIKAGRGHTIKRKSKTV